MLLGALLPTLLLAVQPLPAQAPPGPAPPAGAVPLQPAVLVAPTRIVFDPRRRTAEVNLTNTGTLQGEFRVSLAQMVMDENGGVQEKALERVPGQVALQDLIRFAPHVVNLKPHESQAVRLQVRKPADLPAGEYRVYLVFRAEPPPSAEPVAATPAKGIAIHLTSVFGVAIPVLIRHGATSAKVALTGLAKAADGRSLSFRLERDGNQSVHGDLQASFQGVNGKPRTLGEVNGLSVFCPNPLRNVAMTLDTPVPEGPGTLKVTYTAPEDQGGGLLAEGTLEVR